jgi:hypothetical protein
LTSVNGCNDDAIAIVSMTIPLSPVCPYGHG